VDKPAPAASEPAQLKPELGLGDLTLFAIAFIVGPRWIAIAAHAGPGSIVLWVIAAVLFAGPLGVAVAALLQKYPGAGGLYLWTRKDFGPWHGFLAFWIYWFGIALTLPGSVMFAVSMSAYALGPGYAHLADSRVYVLVVSLVVIWIAIGTNLVGMKVGKWTENAGGVTSWILGALLVALAALVWSRRGGATPLHIWPTWNWDTLGFFGAIAFALSGMEVLGLMGSEIHSPERTVVPATWIGTVFATVFYAATTVALLVLLNPASISELHGLADGTNVAARLFGLSWLTPLVAVLVMINGIGGFGAFGASVSRMPYAAGVDTLLPAIFARVHPRWGVPHISILVFGGVASVLLVAIQLGDTMRAAYQALISLMVLAGFIPYIYIFASAWKCGRRIAAVAGMAVTLFTLVSSVVPTPEVTNVWLFEFKLGAVTALIVVSAWLVYRHNARGVSVPL
jgi:amino acid transporter